jgi:bacterioferritin-associated ferredoxin
MDAPQYLDWNKFKQGNSFALRAAVPYLTGVRPRPHRTPAMIVCSCNVLSDSQIRTAVTNATPRSAAQVYGCLGCSPQCGRCVTTIRRIMDEALGACPAGGECCADAEGA